MRKFITGILLPIFFIWLLPLGAFIHPSQERTACAGERAICLCSHLMVKLQKNSLTQVSLKNSRASSPKEESSSAGGHYFLATQLNYKDIRNNVIRLDENPAFYSTQFLKSIEHVPKV